MKKVVLIGALCAFAAASVTPALAGGSWKGKVKGKAKFTYMLKHKAPGNPDAGFRTLKKMPDGAKNGHGYKHNKKLRRPRKKH